MLATALYIILCLVADKCIGDEKFFSIKNLHSGVPNSITIATLVGAVAASTNIFSCKIANAIDMKRNQPTMKLESISVDAASVMILSLCSQTVEAARLTGRILYRGEGEDSGGSNLERCKLIYADNLTDLTVEGTYVSNPMAAVDYFSSLDRALFSSCTNSLSEQSKDLKRLLSFRPESLPYIAEQAVRPKYGHLATSNIQAASAWGIPVSVWPVDVGFHYAWLRTQSEWWQDEWTQAAPMPRRSVSAKVNWKQPFFWRSPQLLMEFINSEVRQDTALETALYTGKEVYF